jgi:hypothetical protein
MTIIEQIDHAKRQLEDAAISLRAADESVGEKQRFKNQKYAVAQLATARQTVFEAQAALDAEILQS